MPTKEKSRFLKRIVFTCITSIILFGIAAYISAWFKIDTVPIMTIIASVFGGELLLTVILKLLEKVEKKETKNNGQN